MEYRQVILKTPHPTPPAGRYLLEVRHGWWDETNKEALGKQPLISSPFETWDEAETAFKIQLNHSIELGFIHAFHFDPLNNVVVYQDLTE